MYCSDKIELFWQGLEPHLSERARERAEATVVKTGQSLPVTLTQLGLVQENQILILFEEIFDIKTVDLSSLKIENSLYKELNSEFLLHKKLLPYRGNDESSIQLAMVDPLDEEALEGIRFPTGKIINIVAIGYSIWRKHTQLLHQSDQTEKQWTERSDGQGLTSLAGWTDDASRLKDLASEAPVIQFVENLLTNAFDQTASDIHVEPSPGRTRIRFRIDGQMTSHATEAAHLHR